MRKIFRSRWFVGLVLLTGVPVAQAANSPQLFSLTNWATASWILTSDTFAQTTPVFNTTTNQPLRLFLTNMPSGAVLTFDWTVSSGISGDSLAVRKNGTGVALASIANGSQTNIAVDLDAGTYFMEFLYIRNSTVGGTSLATLSNVVLHLPPGIAPGSVVVTPGVNSVQVEWISDEDSQGQLLYGSSTNLGQATALEAGFATNHSVAVSNWTANVPMYFRIVDSDAMAQVFTNTSPQVMTNALMRSFSSPMLSMSPDLPGFVGAVWNSDPGQWQLLDAPALSASFNVVTNWDAVFSFGITNKVRVPAASPQKYFRLERSAVPGHVEVGP